MKCAVIMKKQQRGKYNKCVETFPTESTKYIKSNLVSLIAKTLLDPTVDAISNKSYNSPV